MTDVSDIIAEINSGDQNASDRLLQVLYDDLRAAAKRQLQNEKPGQTLQATALVHEAWLRLIGGDQQWNSRGHFYASAAEAMRRILVEQARRKLSKKRGGELGRIDIEVDQLAGNQPDRKMLALDEALEKLAAISAQKADLVKLRFFAGLTNEQAARALKISTSTADRYWAYAKAWLKKEMSGR